MSSSLGAEEDPVDAVLSVALEGFTKKTQKTPARTIQLAERRLADWRGRGKETKKS